MTAKTKRKRPTAPPKTEVPKMMTIAEESYARAMRERTMLSIANKRQDGYLRGMSGAVEAALGYLDGGNPEAARAALATVRMAHIDAMRQTVREEHDAMGMKGIEAKTTGSWIVRYRTAEDRT